MTLGGANATRSPSGLTEGGLSGEWFLASPVRLPGVAFQRESAERASDAAIVGARGLFAFL